MIEIQQKLFRWMRLGECYSYYEVQLIMICDFLGGANAIIKIFDIQSKFYIFDFLYFFIFWQCITLHPYKSLMRKIVFESWENLYLKSWNN